MVFCCQCWPESQHGMPTQENTLRNFTRVELLEAIEKFKQFSVPGESHVGSVYMGVVTNLTYPYDNINVAVKRVQTAQMGKRRLESELRYIGNIKHQNLVKLIGYCNEDSKNEMLLVYEYLPNYRSLDHYLPSLPWSMRLRIAKDAAAGLAYLHDQTIIFKDFKPSNILLDNRMKAKLSYFGFVSKAPQDRQTQGAKSVVGTKGYSYSAPEYDKKGNLTTQMDLWSYGIFLHELITGGSPITEENLENNPECMRWVCCNAGAGIIMSKLKVDPMLVGKYSEESMQKIVSIANKCLVLEPHRRPRMSAVLKMVKEAIELETSILPSSKCCLDLRTR